MESKNPEPPDGNSVVLPVASAPATEPLDYSIAMNSAPQAGASAIEGSPDAAVSASQPSEPSFVTSSTTSRNSVVPPDMKPWEFWMIFVGLGLAVFLAALDQTIVSVAIPSIVTEFQTVTGIAWVGIGYFITAVPLIPTYGLLSDILGRKFVYLAAIFFFELGSLICGVAPSMTVLILGRAVAGLGGGAILSLSLIIIADYVAIEKRGLFAGVIGACFAIASVVGPLLGGVFTEQLTWRWCFFINLPIGFITIVTIFFFMRIPVKAHAESKLHRLARIDWIGTIVLTIGVICFLLGLTTGGSEYPWNSAFVISFTTVGACLIAVFFVWEAVWAKNGVLPIEFYVRRFTLGSFFTAFMIGMTFFAMVYYIPIYFQVATGEKPTQAGVSTLPLVFGVVLGNLFCGAVASVTGRAWQFIPLGAIIAGTGAGLLSTLALDSSSGQRIGYLIVAGAGSGMLVQMNLLVAQGSTTQEKVALVTANTAFWQNLGAVIGIAILGTVYGNILEPKLIAYLPPGTPVEPFMNSPSLVSKLPMPLRALVQQAYIETLSTMFKIVIGTAGGVFLGSMLLRKDKLGPKKADAGEAKEAEPPALELKQGDGQTVAVSAESAM